MYVARRSDTKQYIPTGATWSRRWTEDLQKARTYSRACDAKNSAGSYCNQVPDGVTVEAVPVVLALTD